MMWGPWGAPMWGFGWIFPLFGLLIVATCVFVMIRAMSSGHGFMCMGGHGGKERDESAELRREIGELREEIKQLRASR